MRWALLVVLTVLLGAGVLTYSTGRVPINGCRLSSVDERPWVEANRALLDGLPVFPGATKVSSNTSPWSVSSNRCFAFENSGPYDSYQTSDRFALPAEGRALVPAPTWYDRGLFGESVQAVLAFYDRELPRDGWRLSHYSGGQVWYRKQGALLCVSAFTESPRYSLDMVWRT